MSPLITATGALGIALCLWGMTKPNLNAWLTLGALALAGCVLYAVAGFARRRAAIR